MLLDILLIAGVSYGSFWLGGKFTTLQNLGKAIVQKLEGKA
jgi:hypothetical protein